MLVDLLKQIGSSEINCRRNDISPEALVTKSSCDALGNGEKATCSRASTISADEHLRGDIFLPNARIILCFPYKEGGDSEGYSFFEHFVALDFSCLPSLRDKRTETMRKFPVTRFEKGPSEANCRSLHLHLGDLDAYLISSDTGEDGGSELCEMMKLKFYAQKIMSIADGTNNSSVISMIWREGALAGPWITRRAKILATAEHLRSRDRFMGEDYEFVPVTNAKDMEDFDTHTQQEIISSSSFFLHAQFCTAVINLEKVQYDNLISLVHQLGGCLSGMSSGPTNTEFPSQGSILVECDSLVISVTMEEVEGVKSAIQKELPGSWHGLKIQLQKFELLSVSNIGSIRDGSFLWVAHKAGNLLGSISGVPHEELLLISCSNSTMGRGGGEGSNILSPCLSGSDIVHLWHPEESHSYTSISVRCGTVIALGGRLDWCDAISSFFSVTSEFETEFERTCGRAGSERIVPSESSFVLNLVDVALSYEPYFSGYLSNEGSNMQSCSARAVVEQYFACLLAASSFRLSNTRVSNSSLGEYKIRLQDLGMLLRPVYEPKSIAGNYNSEHLRMVGYVKIAQAAHFEALLRTFCDKDLVWEVETSGPHIVLSTCWDTAAGLIHLCTQLQQLFAPDMEDTLVHLQTRWNDVKRAKEDTENMSSDGDAGTSEPKLQDMDQNSRHRPCTGNLMDEICDDTFRLDENSEDQVDHCGENLNMLFSNRFLAEPIKASGKDAGKSSDCFPFTGSISVVGMGNSGSSFQHEDIPEYMEEYFLSDLHPLPALSTKGYSSNDISECNNGFINSEQVQIRNNGWYGDTTLRILENHISEVNQEIDTLHLEDCETSSGKTEPDDYGKVKGCVLLKNMKVVWSLYAGSDWHSFQKIKPSTAISGRDTTVSLEISLTGMMIQHEIFPDGGICVSRLSVTIEEFCLNDNSKNAPWKLVLGHYHSKDYPRKSSSKALKLDLESVRPDPSIFLEEYRLRIAFLPIRVHLHQNHLNFLVNFFGGECSSIDSSQRATQDGREVEKETKKSTNLGGHVVIEEALLPFFQKFDIRPLVIRVDYCPRHVDLAALRSGKYVELVNLVPWKGVELELKHVTAVGVYGWNSVCETILGEWLEDISQNQIHKLLKGLPPIRSLVSVGSGAAKLVTLPVRSYKKDRKLIKGMQRGTIAFLRSISIEAIGLGVHLAAGAHDILLQAEYMLTGSPPAVSYPPQSKGHTNVRSNQPKDARQGIKQAYESMSDGLSKAASALVRAPLKRYQRGDGVGSALATAVQAAPVAAIAPASAAARAMHYTFLGVRNSLDPEHKKESLDKYLGATHHQEFM